MDNNNDTALLIMDMQTGILRNYPAADELINHAKEAINIARSRGMRIVYIVVGLRQGAPEVSTSNKTFNKERFANMNMEDFMTIHPDLAPQANEIVVIKRRISAFTGSDLEVVLRAWGIRHLILTGIASSGVVLSTLREAADKDYRLTIVADACGDADEEVHRVLMTKIFPRQADVMNVADWEQS